MRPLRLCRATLQPPLPPRRSLRPLRHVLSALADTRPDHPQPPSSQPALDAAIADLPASFDDRHAPSSQPSLDGAIAALPASFDARATIPAPNPFSSSLNSVYAPAALPPSVPALAVPPTPGLTPSQQEALDSIFASQGVASFTPASTQALPPPLPFWPLLSATRSASRPLCLLPRPLFYLLLTLTCWS